MGDRKGYVNAICITKKKLSNSLFRFRSAVFSKFLRSFTPQSRKSANCITKHKKLMLYIFLHCVLADAFYACDVTN